MKLLHVITTIERGGAENQLLILVKRQIQRGHEVTITFLKGSADLKHDFDLIGASTIDLSKLSFFQQIIFFRNKLASQFDILHAHLPRSEILTYLGVVKSNRNFIITRHNSEKFFPKAPKLISSFLSRIVTHRAFKIISISNAVFDFCISNQEIENDSKCITIHYGFDFEVTVKRNFSNQLHLLFVGRLEDQKDIPTLLKALKEISHEKIFSQISILGNGSLRKDLQSLAEQYEIDKSIRWLGKIPNVDEYMQSCDLLVLTSKYEGFGLVLLEAISQNLPVLATNTTSIPEVLGSDYLGLFPVGNFLLLAELFRKFKNDSFYREQLINQLYFRKEFFSSTKMESSVNNVYINLIKS